MVACLSVYLFVCIWLEKLRTGFREVGRTINFRYDMIYIIRHGGVYGEKSGGNVGGVIRTTSYCGYFIELTDSSARDACDAAG